MPNLLVNDYNFPGTSRKAAKVSMTEEACEDTCGEENIPRIVLVCEKLGGRGWSCFLLACCSAFHFLFPVFCVRVLFAVDL